MKQEIKISECSAFAKDPPRYDVEGGKKYDTGKDRWDLIPFGALVWIVKVLTFGANKYGANNWQKLKEPNGRYYAACLRHLYAWRTGEKKDPESGLPHLAHALCCLVFLLSLETGLDPVLDNG